MLPIIALIGNGIKTLSFLRKVSIANHRINLGLWESGLMNRLLLSHPIRLGLQLALKLA